MPGAGADHHSGGGGIEAMDSARPLRGIGRLQEKLERVAIESSSRMHRKRRRFVHDHKGLVLMQDADIRTHRGLHLPARKTEIPLSCTHDVICRNRRIIRADESALRTKLKPILAGNMTKNPAERIKQALPVILFRHLERTAVVAWNTARQRRGRLADELLAHRNALHHNLRAALKTIRTRFARHESGVALLYRIERGLAHITLR